MADTPTPTLHDRLVAMLTAGERLRRTAPVDDDFPELMHNFDGAMRTAREALDAAGGAAPFDLVAHLHRQRAFSLATFGPGQRTAGVLDHIRKELVEVERAPTDVAEWADVVILALDGAWRAGHQPRAIVDAIVAKQTRNEGRTWPDWRTADPGKAIEHDRAGEVTGDGTGTALPPIESTNPVEVMRALVVEAADEAGLELDHASFDRAAASLVDAEDPDMVADHAAALASIPRPVEVMPATLSADATTEQVTAFFNADDEAREARARAALEVEQAAELSRLRGTVERQRRELEDVAHAAGMLGAGVDEMPSGDLVALHVQQLRESRERVETQATEAMRMLWLVVRIAGAPKGVTIPLREVIATDWSRCALRRDDSLADGGIHLAAVVTDGRGAVPPMNLEESAADAARRLAGELVAVADALGFDEGADLSQLLATIDGLKERAARVIDRRMEQLITSALGCDETPAAILDAIKALKHQAGLGGPSVHQRMHQQLLDMLGSQDHQGAAARIGELVGLELLLHAGGAGKGVTAIAQERRGQIEREGYNPDDDMEYTGGELVQAAVAYALWGHTEAEDREAHLAVHWPGTWNPAAFKPRDDRANLVRAGALIAAELDRMDRAASHG